MIFQVSLEINCFNFVVHYISTMRMNGIVSLILCSTLIGYAQVGIGTTNPQAALEVTMDTSFWKGLRTMYLGSDAAHIEGNTVTMFNWGPSDFSMKGEEVHLYQAGSGNGNLIGVEVDLSDTQTGTSVRDIIGLKVETYVSDTAGTSTNYGISVDSWGFADIEYAGYFDGDVYTTGAFVPSDFNLKENINLYSGALDQINKLEVRHYNYETEKFPFLNLPKGDQVGLISQNVQQVFPNLVKETKHIGKKTNKELDELGWSDDQKSEYNRLIEMKKDEDVMFLAVNYTGLVPILLRGIQEQQEIIDLQNIEIDQLKSRILKIEQKLK